MHYFFIHKKRGINIPFPRLLGKLFLTMKLIAFMILIMVTTAYAEGNAQKITVNFKKANIDKVFEAFSKQTKYRFFYHDDVVAKTGSIDLDVNGEELSTVLDHLSEKHNLRYKVISNTITVARKHPVAEVTEAEVQQRPITGRVLDEQGNPLQGASVVVKNTQTGTTTQENGAFTLNVANLNVTLVISFVGHISQEVALAGRESVQVTLARMDESLDEVVIVGYGTQRRSEATGSIASVSGTTVADKPSVSFESSLAGRATGVNMVANDGVVNQAPVFRIRGTNSLSLSSYPLVVVDGVPMFTDDVNVGGNASNNPLAALNSADIESIDIAKDAAATSIYGSRAANGVVFITTKSGKRGSARFNYSMFVGQSKAVRLAEVLNADQYLEIKNEGLMNAGTYDPVRNYFGKSLDANGNEIDTRWYDYIFREGISQNHNLNMSGANERSKYYFSIGLDDRKGILRGNDYGRKSVSYNLEHKITDWLTIGSKTNYSNDFTTAVLSTGNGTSSVSANSVAYRLGFITAPIVGPFNRDGSYNITGPNVGVMDNDDHLQSHRRLGYTNPVLTLERNRDRTGNNYVQSNAFLDLRPVSWLSLRSVYGINNMYSRTERYFDPLTNEAGSTNGRATGVSAKREISIWTNTATVDQNFGSHSVNLLLGHEVQESKGDQFGLTRTNQSDPYYTDIQGGFGNVAIINTANQRYYNYLTSMFSRVQYSYDGKYLVTANLRRDESSVLGPKNKAGVFWGFSGGWEVSRENFWQGSALADAISNFKIRASYGKVGNLAGIGDYASLSTYSAILYGGVSGLYYSGAGNEDLKWETSKKTDIGLNFSIMDGRLAFDLSYYNNNIDGLIFGVPAPASAGLPNPSTGLQNTVLANVGSMYNRGVELAVNGSVLQRENWSWNSSFNISYNKNEVVSLAPGVDNLIFNDVGGSSGQVSISLPGKPVGMIYAIRTDGVDPQSGRRVFLDGSGRKVLFQQIPGPGQYQWEYEDGTQAPAVSTSEDGVIYKNTNPSIYGGWSNNLSYGNFDLDFLFTYQYGGHMYFATQASLMDHRFQNNSVKVLDRWQKPGDVTDVPRLVDGDITSWGYSIPITANVYKTDFVRLKNLTLGYTLPRSLVQRASINNVRVYVSGQNVLLFTKYPGADPETTSTGNASATQGFDKNMTPNARIMTFGLQIGF